MAVALCPAFVLVFSSMEAFSASREASESLTKDSYATCGRFPYSPRIQDFLEFDFKADLNSGGMNIPLPLHFHGIPH